MKKGLLILGVVVLLVIVVGGFLVYTNKDKLANMAIEKGFEALETKVLANLPQSIPADSAKAIFASALSKVQRGEVDQARLQKMFTDMQTTLQESELDSTHVANLLHRVAALTAPAETAQK